MEDNVTQTSDEPQTGVVIAVDEEAKGITMLQAQRQQIMEALTQIELQIALKTELYLNNSMQQSKGKIGF